MDFEITKLQFYVISYAVMSTLFMIGLLYYSLDLLKKFEEGHIYGTNCCRCLNALAPYKTALHLHLPFVLLFYGPLALSLLNVPLIWHWNRLPVGYQVDDIDVNGKAPAHKRDINNHLRILWTCVGVYIFFLTTGIFKTLP